MTYKQQITPWSIYDNNFKSARENYEYPEGEKLGKIQQVNKVYKNQGKISEKRKNYANIEAFLKKKIQSQSQTIQKNNSEPLHYNQFSFSSKKYQSMINGKAMKYHNYQKVIQNQSKQQISVHSEYGKAVRAINNWLLTIIIKQQIENYKPQIQQEKLILPKIRSKSNSLIPYEVEIARQNRGNQKKLRQIEEKMHSKQKDFETIHIGRVLEGFSHEKIKKEFSQQKIWHKKEDKQQIRSFPKKQSSQGKFVKIKQNKKLLSELYSQTEEFQDKQIHQKVQLTKKRPFKLKHSSFVNERGEKEKREKYFE